MFIVIGWRSSSDSVAKDELPFGKQEVLSSIWSAGQQAYTEYSSLQSLITVNRKAKKDA